MSDQTFKVGDEVVVINTTFGGQKVIEGKATVLKVGDEVDSQYLVRFKNGDKVWRWIDPAAQADPQQYVDQLNGRVQQ